MEFVQFSRDLANCAYVRNLPHWRQPGSTYFVTFRLADSIPRNVIAAWNEEREIWAQANGVTGSPGSEEWASTYPLVPERERRLYENRFIHRYHQELDKCQGKCVLRDPGLAGIVHDALLFWHERNGMVGDVVVMPNHVHALITPLTDIEPEEWMGSVKRFTSTRINRALEHKGIPLWQAETYDHIVRDREELARIRRYIRSNPVDSKLTAGAYLYQHAEWMDEWCDMDLQTLATGTQI